MKFQNKAEQLKEMGDEISVFAFSRETACYDQKFNSTMMKALYKIRDAEKLLKEIQDTKPILVLPENM